MTRIAEYSIEGGHVVERLLGLSGGLPFPKRQRVSLEAARADVRAILDQSPGEARGVLDALKRGRVNGQVYDDDAGCGCLIGTVERLRAERGKEQLAEIRGLLLRPAEYLFLTVEKGDTPATSKGARLAAQYVREWLAEREASAPAAVERELVVA